jgi:biopolymer transport protein ExbB
MEPLLEQFGLLWQQAVEIWSSGGWAMPAIAANALLMFGLGVHVFFKLREKGFRSVSEKTWRRWIDHPSQRKGPVGELLNFVTRAHTLDEMAVNFDEVRATEVEPFQRDLLVMKICVGAAPLLGLLGTVTGMLSTFDALSKGSGGDETFGLVAGGISEALITTETGLVIALPGLFLQHVLSRNYQRYRSFVAHVETVCTQAVYRKLKALNQDRAA